MKQEKLMGEWNTLLCIPRMQTISPQTSIFALLLIPPLFQAVRGKDHIIFGFKSPNCFLILATPAWQEKELLPHNLTLLPSPSFLGMASNIIKSRFFTEQLQTRLSLWERNATNCGASIVWAIQWAFHFQSKSKLVKVSLYKLPCWETAACIKITIILFCHVRSKG